MLETSSETVSETVSPVVLRQKDETSPPLWGVSLSQEPKFGTAFPRACQTTPEAKRGVFQALASQQPHAHASQAWPFHYKPENRDE
jgi:hypothetical protein